MSSNVDYPTEPKRSYGDLKRIVSRKVRKRRDPNKTLGNLSGLIFNTTIASIGIQVAASALKAMFFDDELKRSRELALMNAVEVVVIDKSYETQYHELEGIEKYLKGFCKRNPKWSWEKEKMGDMETGRYVLQRKYRKYTQKDREDVCEYCGRSHYD